MCSRCASINLLLTTERQRTRGALSANSSIMKILPSVPPQSISTCNFFMIASNRVSNDRHASSSRLIGFPCDALIICTCKPESTFKAFTHCSGLFFELHSCQFCFIFQSDKRTNFVASSALCNYCIDLLKFKATSMSVTRHFELLTMFVLATGGKLNDR